MRLLSILLLFYCFFLGAETYDCFTFFDELELLEVRLAELNEEVDHFILVEATETFSGLPKPLYFTENAQRFEKYKDKITCIVVDDFPPPSEDLAADRWKREEYQRNAVARGLSNCCDEDIIILSDLDEIPRKEAVQEAKRFLSRGRRQSARNQNLGIEQLACSFSMQMFLYKLDYLSPFQWLGGSKAASFGVFSQYRPWDFKILHNFKTLHTIENGGWHFHTMGGIEQVQKKIESIYLYDKESFLPPDEFKKLHLEAYGLKNTSIDSTFPKYILENIEHFEKLGWIEEARVGIN